MKNRTVAAVVLATLGLASVGCNGPRRIHEVPVLLTGDRVDAADAAIADAQTRESALQLELRRQRDSVRAVAAATCTPEICAAMARGDVVLGMTEAQLLAASNTTESAWSARRTNGVSVLVPASADVAPRDATGALAMVQLVNGTVSSVSWRERTGLRVVSTASDTSAAAKASVFANALVREGDDYLVAGDRVRALDRYDRALVLRSNDAMLNFKVAQLLDQQLRPLEASMRYQRFLQQMELQRIEAVGTQNAKLAEAIALAQQRLVVLDRRPR